MATALWGIGKIYNLGLQAKCMTIVLASRAVLTEEEFRCSRTVNKAINSLTLKTSVLVIAWPHELELHNSLDLSSCEGLIAVNTVYFTGFNAPVLPNSVSYSKCTPYKNEITHYEESNCHNRILVPIILEKRDLLK